MVTAAVEFRVEADDVCCVAVTVLALSVVAKVVRKAPPFILALAAVLTWLHKCPVAPMVMVEAFAFVVPVITVFSTEIPSSPLFTAKVNGPTAVPAVVLLLDLTDVPTGDVWSTPTYTAALTMQ